MSLPLMYAYFGSESPHIYEQLNVITAPLLSRALRPYL